MTYWFGILTQHTIGSTFDCVGQCLINKF